MACGVVGLGAIAASVLRGAVVIAVDVDDAKLERARRLGARSLVTHRFPLMRIPDALAFWDAHVGEVVKIVASVGGAPS